ncbi:asparagine synthetase B family protein [Rhodocyclaceae bacterium SMB388]
MENVLHARFFGRVAHPSSSTNVPASHLAADHPGHSVIAFDGGYVAHTADTPALRDGTLICVAPGEPRFDDAELAALVTTRGPAAAWIEAFRRHGDRATALAKGRFAVVLIDADTRQTRLMTDRFGTWPLCHAEHDGALCFSDRADSIPDVARRLSHQAVFDYLYFHMIPAPQTIFDGIRRLPAAHALNWSDGQTTITPWWTPRFDEHHFPDLEDSKRQFLDIVERSVALEARGHEDHIGCFLSGGTDSSTVAGMLTKALGQPAKSYSIGFDASGYDEMEYARIAANRFGVDHHEYYVTPDDLLGGIPKVAVHYDQPFGNSSAVPAWICASRARADGVDKLLAGDGGDELFGGNTRYAKQRVFGWYDTIPGLMRKAALEPVLALPGMNRIPLIKKGVSYVEQARVPMPDRQQMYNMLHRLGPASVFTPEFLAGVDTGLPLQQQRDTWQGIHAGALINHMLAWDWKYTLSDNDLPKVIGTTQLAGLDVGFPLLSDELLEFSLSIPPDWKLKGLTLRWFFKEALRGFLPDEIIAKKKHGFGLPFGVWACQHSGLKALARDTLGTLKQRGIVRTAFIDELLDTHLPTHPGYYGEMVWILMMMELWLRQHSNA